MKKVKVVFHVVLVAAILVVVYLIYESVQQPIRFNAEQTRRYEATIQRLKDIRTAQLAFRSEYKKYTGCFDSLIDFLKTDSFRVMRVVGDVDDSASVAAGRITRETVLVPVMDSLFRRGYPVDSLRFVPFTQGVEFELGTNNIIAGNVTVNVFEAKVSNDVLLHGLDAQLLFNYNTERMARTGYAGLKVGSLTETTNNAGNWE